jgi:xanthine dehydrogenase molybdenum-binding subunit
MDQIASVLGVDPVTLRESILVRPNEIDRMSGKSLGDARVLECLQRGAQAFNWSARAAQTPGLGRWRRAVGMACGAHKNGMLSEKFPESSSMTLKMNEDGSLNLSASVHEVGAGAQVMLRLVVAEVLGVPPERITVGEADSETTPFDFGCFGSRVTYVCGAAARELAITMHKRLLEEAAALLNVEIAQLDSRNGLVVEREGARSLTYREVVQHARMQHSCDMVVTQTYRGQSNPGSYSVQFAEVNVDTYTGRVQVTDFLCVVDIGLALNPGMVEGQCRGAVQAGIGSALCEEVSMNAQGGLNVSGLRDYHLINCVDMPRVDVLLIEHPGDDGPFGAKSVGEVATVPTAAAVVNAVNRALGTTISTLPLIPERILQALQSPATTDAREVTCC